MGLGSIFLTIFPFFGDWWQHDQNKQIIKILKLKNYLLARMQCKGKFIWCKNIPLVKKLRKLILPLQMSPSGITDLSLPLTFSLSRTITTCKLLWSGLLLVLQILPLWNQTLKGKTLVAQGRIKFCDLVCVEWNRSQNLTLTLHRLSSP
jgi:hypothetical protein